MTFFYGRLSVQPWMNAPETRRLMAALDGLGPDAEGPPLVSTDTVDTDAAVDRAFSYKSRFVGGCVRDALANRRVVDIDIATSLLPDEVMARLTAAKINYVPTGLQHGTITAIVDSKPFEITTLRIDSKTDGRRAEVRYTDDWKKDAARRDFTINAMSATIDGDVFDYFGGLEHLRTGRVMFVGEPEKRITEDYLRVLRYFRFLAQFGWGGTDPQALAACEKLAKNVARLSAERIRQETLKILDSERCAEVWQLMITHRVVTHFLPEAMNVTALERLIALEKEHHSAGSAIRRLAAVLDVQIQDIPHITKALRLSNEQADRLTGMKEPFPVAELRARDADRSVRRLVYRRGADMVRSAMLLAEASGAAIPDFAKLYATASSFRAPPFPIEGNDVTALGVLPGPMTGRLLRDVENWWVNEDFQPGRTDCLTKLKAFLS